MKKLYFIIIIFIINFNVNANENIDTILNQHVDYLILNNLAEIENYEKYKEVIKIIYEKTYNNSTPSLEQINQFSAQILDHKLVDRETMRIAYQNMAKLVAKGQKADEMSLLLLFMHPYVKEAGGCTPIEEETEICMFASGPRNANIQSKITHKNINIELSRPAKGSDLEYILNICNQTNDDENLIISNDCYISDYSLIFLYKKKTKFYGTMRVWAEAVGTGWLGLSTSISDTVIANLPLGIRCDYRCLMNALLCYMFGVVGASDEFVATCAIRGADKRDFRMHGENSYIQHVHARECNIMQSEATDREHFKIHQYGSGTPILSDFYNVYYDTPNLLGNVKFQTHFQTSTVIDDLYDSRNIFPLPSSVSLGHVKQKPRMPMRPIELPDNKYIYASKDAITEQIERIEYGLPENAYGIGTWIHKFSKIIGWHYNIIFNATDALHNKDVINGKRCRIALKHPKFEKNIYGDQFQIFYGSAADLPELNIIVGWDTYHPALLCINKASNF